MAYTNCLVVGQSALGEWNELKDFEISEIDTKGFYQDSEEKSPSRILRLRCNKLPALAIAVSRLPALARLELVDNSLTEVPAIIFDVLSLTELDLNKNQISTLPKEISQLSKLEVLSVSYNPLRTLPKEIGKLVRLRELELQHCQLRELPIEIATLSLLSRLVLNSNYISAFPVEWGALTSLKYLHAYGNRIEYLPYTIGNLVNLTSLSLSGNRLRNLPKEIGRLSSIEDLYLYDNMLEDIPEELFSLTSLCSLYLYGQYGTSLAALPPGLTRLSRLRQYDLPECCMFGSEDYFTSKDGINSFPPPELQVVGWQVKTLLQICCQALSRTTEDAANGGNKANGGDFAHRGSPHPICEWLPEELRERFAEGRTCVGCGRIFYGKPVVQGRRVIKFKHIAVWERVSLCSLACMLYYPKTVKSLVTL